MRTTNARAARLAHRLLATWLLAGCGSMRASEDAAAESGVADATRDGAPGFDAGDAGVDVVAPRDATTDVVATDSARADGDARDTGAADATADAGRLATVERPGLSAALFASPPYACVRNYYVATTGSDAADGSAATPWRTLQHADSSARRAGDCINVTPGDYPIASTFAVSHGGNLAAPTGYVAYRCTTLGGCHVTASAALGDFIELWANYLVFDGFELDGNHNTASGACLVDANGNQPGLAFHHLWSINNTIHHCGLSGIQFNNAEYYYVLHNVLHDNSNTNCYQGSGISLAAARAVPGYAPTAMDAADAPFHNVVSYNVSHHNLFTATTTCGNEGHTDANGIIIDTFDNQGSTGVAYPDQTLVAFNIAYANGGTGMHAFRTSLVTFANNTVYDNNLDPLNSGTFRTGIGVSGGHQNTVINNVAIAITGTGILADNVPFGGGSAAGEVDASNTWTHNIAFGGTAPYGAGAENAFFGADTFDCAANRCRTDPALVGPAAANFALTPSSPALGAAMTASYLPAAPLDVGACDHSLTACP